MVPSDSTSGKQARKTIFVVDDNDVNLFAADDALSKHYKVMTLPSAAKMFAFLERVKPDLILLDIEMPEMDGFQALARLKANDAQMDIPVIFLTSITDAQVEAKGFQMGAIDFITKPFSAPVLLNRIKTHLDIDELIRERTEQLHQKTASLEKKTQELEKLQNGMVFVMSDLVESRDEGTGGHIERTAILMRVLADSMIENDVYKEELLKMDLDIIESTSRLHDVGKIVISDKILNKPGKLTDDEFLIMKTHAAESENIINQLVSRAGEMAFCHYAKELAGYHHERWDGKGYPRGLSKEEIPLLARMMAIVDVYDALTSERPYKKGISHRRSVEIIMEGAGTHFDPYIADLFYKVNHLMAESISLPIEGGEDLI